MASTTALFTGLSGLTSNSRRLDVIGNNIANVNTTAFKSNRISFAPTFSRNFSLGTAPGDVSGGTNPGQIGLGVQVSGTQRNFGNGAIGATGVATDVAIEGDGFFIVDMAGQQMYTRAGAFVRNPENDLVSISGARVMGFGVDDQFNVVEGTLEPLNIPLGTLTLAEATRNVTFNGNLNAAGSVGTTGSIHVSRGFFLDAGLTMPATGLTDVTASDLFIDDGTGTGVLAFDSAASPVVTVSGVEKGGKDMGTRTFAFSAVAVDGTDDFGTTLNDFAAFLEDVLGLDSSTVGGQTLGGGITIGPAGQLVVVGNEGEVQDLDIETADLLVTGNGSGLGQPFVMSKTGEADGESVRTSFVVYDSLGTPLTIDLSLVLQETSPSEGTTWQFIAESSESDSIMRMLGMGVLTFDANGRFVAASNQAFSVSRQNGAVDPLTINMEFNSGADAVSALTDVNSNLAAVFQDGSAIGTLSAFSIGQDGILSGSFTNGLTRTIGQLVLAKFPNAEGLVDAGDNMFRTGPNSGTPLVAEPLSFGTGRVLGGALELSNVDLSQEFINMILASTGYSAASRVITTTDELINELLLIGR